MLVAIRPSVAATLVLAAGFLGAPRLLLAQDSLPDYQRGFPPNGTFQVNGIDNVNLFNGNLTLDIPLGPNYPIGPGFSQQLRLTYNAQIWRRRLACSTGQDLYGMYVDGLPTFGVGWSLDFGHVSGSTDPDGFSYVSPDGSSHPIGSQTIDSTYTRMRNLGMNGTKAWYADLDFANGTKGVFNQRVDVNFDDRAQDFHAQRLHVTELRDPNGNRIVVNYLRDYEVTDGQFRIWRVHHFRHNATTGADDFLRTIVFHYSALTVDNRPYGGAAHNTWAVLSSIELPAAQGLTQTVRFDYYDRGFGRARQDETSGCVIKPAKPSVDVAAPLLRSVQLDASLPTLSYQFEYATQLSPRLETDSGVLTRLTSPTGGTVDYGWYNILSPICGQDCSTTFWHSDTLQLTSRIERPQGPAGPAYEWDYFFGPQQYLNYPYTWSGTVVAPDGIKTVHTYHLESNERAGVRGHGLRFKTGWFDSAWTLLRERRYCYDADSGYTNVCNEGSTLPDYSYNVRESRVETTAVGTPQLTTKVQRTNWDGFGHWGRVDTYDWDNATLRRSVVTQWTPNSADWLLELFDRRTVTDPSAPAGQQTVDSWFEFVPTTGFLKGTFIHDATRSRVLLTCRYPDSFGNVGREFSASYPGFPLPPPVNACSGNYPTWPTPPVVPVPVIGLNGDAFGKEHTYLNGLRTSTRWVSDNTPLPWRSQDVSLDPMTGAVVSSRDTAGIPTSYTYDVLGRVVILAPQGEAATQIAYDSPTQVTVSRGGIDGNGTWQRSLYDGFGRLSREMRLLPGSSYSMRFHSYDSVGRQDFLSEWALCTSATACAATTPTQGTTWSTFDPFGRARTITRADGQVTALCYQDDGTQNAAGCQGPHSETLVKSTTNVGGTPATAVTRKDVLGRIVAVAEPDTGTGADVTTYSYSAVDKLAAVSQGAQSRTFEYDAFGFLRREVTPEAGTTQYDEYGSLGNLLRVTEPGTLVLNRSYDAAGRLTGITSNEGGSRVYLSNTYDDVAAGSSAGKLTQSISYNPSLPATIIDAFRFDGIGGRLSRQTTQVPLSSGTQSLVQKWFYNSLGLPAAHHHPRVSGAAPFVASTSYDAGIPVSIRINGLPAVSGVTYHPYVGIASYATGTNTGSNVSTTTQLAASSMPRPSRISATREGGLQLFDSGAYSYDASGNVSAIGSDQFTYDARLRLKSALYAGIGSQAYTYDRWGNLLTKGPAAFPADASSNHLTTAGYDLRGNITSYGSELFGYDALGRLYYSRPVSLPFFYGFDGANERILRIPPAPAERTFTLRDATKRVTTETVGSTISRDDIFLGSLLLVSYSNCQVTGNCRIGSTDIGPWQYYSSDHLGSPRLITDLRGTVLDQRKYWPFGDEAAGSASSPQRIRFAGMERDTEGNDYYDHARSHHFNLSRFLSPDPVAGEASDPQSWNRYTYVRNRPLVLIDPDGRQTANPDDPSYRSKTFYDEWSEVFNAAKRFLLRKVKRQIEKKAHEKLKQLEAERKAKRDPTVKMPVDDMKRMAPSDHDWHVKAKYKPLEKPTNWLIDQVKNKVAGTAIRVEEWFKTLTRMASTEFELAVERPAKKEQDYNTRTETLDPERPEP